MNDDRVAVVDSRRFAFFMADNELIDTYGPQIGAYGVAVYAVLCRYANNEGQAWPSRATIAKQLDISVATVIRTMAKLEAAGLIVLRRPEQHALGKHETTVYTLLPIGKHPSISQQPGLVADSNQPSSSQQPPWLLTATPLVADSNTKKTQRKRLNEGGGEIAPAEPVPIPQPAIAPTDRGTRLTLAALPDEWRAFARERRPDLNPDAVWQKFENYWKAKAGAGARKVSWLRTWQNWVIDQTLTPAVATANGHVSANGAPLRQLTSDEEDYLFQTAPEVYHKATKRGGLPPDVYRRLFETPA